MKIKLSSYIKKDRSDFCEGCSVLGLYNTKTKNCILCDDESLNEDYISNKKFSDLKKHDHLLGYYVDTISAVSKKYQAKSSAGGLVSAINYCLLKNKLVDGIVSVSFNNKLGIFEYQLCTNPKDLYLFQRSSYYPVKLDKAINIIKKFEGTVSITCIPSAAKAIEILKMRDPELSKKVKYTIGLVCGHVKKEDYLDYLCKKAGKTDGIKGVNYASFREKKLSSKYSGGDYYFVVKKNKNEWSLKSSQIKANWPGGLFKEFASDFDDDVFAECADVTVMDAWLKKYKNSDGVSLAIIRNKNILSLIQNNSDLSIKKVNKAEIIESQAGGIRHKRDGLKIRLAFYKFFRNDVPIKRVSPSFGIDPFNILCQLSRLCVSIKSNILYKQDKNPSIFDQKMRAPLNILYLSNLPNKFKNALADKVNKVLKIFFD